MNNDGNTQVLETMATAPVGAEQQPAQTEFVAPKTREVIGVVAKGEGGQKVLSEFASVYSAQMRLDQVLPTDGTAQAGVVSLNTNDDIVGIRPFNESELAQADQERNRQAVKTDVRAAVARLRSPQRY